MFKEFVKYIVVFGERKSEVSVNKSQFKHVTHLFSFTGLIASVYTANATMFAVFHYSNKDMRLIFYTCLCSTHGCIKRIQMIADFFSSNGDTNFMYYLFHNSNLKYFRIGPQLWYSKYFEPYSPTFFLSKKNTSCTSKILSTYHTYRSKFWGFIRERSETHIFNNIRLKMCSSCTEGKIQRFAHNAKLF